MPRKPTCECGVCKKCRHRIRMREWTEANREKTRAWARRRYRRLTDTDPAWVESEKARHAEKEQRDAPLRQAQKAQADLEHPEKNRARRAVADALRAGVLVRPLHCDRCGHQRRVQAHHHDYAEPLNVEWVCTSCHAEEHRHDDA